MTGVVPYDDSVILTTTDGGDSWTTASYLENFQIYSFCFVDSLEGFLCGADGKILKSTDGGINWIPSYSGTEQNFHSINFVNHNTGWVVGAKSTIMKTSTGGISFVSDNHFTNEIQDFNLSQNYPNPFNPTTTISYQISQRGLVTLKVYDVLGREVATIVNEEKISGSYEIKFDGSDLSSGVYFYKLQAGSFVQTRKMIYLK